jgi:hypothetical protein
MLLAATGNVSLNIMTGGDARKLPNRKFEKKIEFLV